jgi:hypothetical protein
MTDEFDAVLELVRSDFTATHRLSYDSLDLKMLLQLVESHKLGSYAACFAKGDLPTALTAQFAQIRQSASAHFDKSQSLICQFDDMFRSEKLGFAVIKGVGLNHCVYDPTVVRAFGDIDILIKPEDAQSVHQLLKGAGFFQKRGITSTVSQPDRHSRAFLALTAKYVGSTYDAPDFPIKGSQDQPQYKPYCRESDPSIEVHDGLYFLTDEAVQKMRSETVRIQTHEGTYMTLNPECTLILLLTNTYENSESFYGNTFDYGLVLRDYVDLRYFFEKYHKMLNWLRIEKLIDAFGIRRIASIVLGNLLDVYDRDVTHTCLPSIEPADSEWHVKILDRMKDLPLARASALRVARKHWLMEGSASPLCIHAAQRSSSSDTFIECETCNEVFFRIEYMHDTFMLSWSLPLLLWSQRDDFLYQIRFFPLSDEVPYTLYKVDFIPTSDGCGAYGHRTERYTRGATRKEKEGGASFSTSLRQHDRLIVVSAVVPFSILELRDVCKKQSLCVSVEIYRRHYKEIYHRLHAGLPEPRMHLMEFQ